MNRNNGIVAIIYWQALIQSGSTKSSGVRYVFPLFMSYRVTRVVIFSIKAIGTKFQRRKDYVLGFIFSSPVLLDSMIFKHLQDNRRVLKTRKNEINSSIPKQVIWGAECFYTISRNHYLLRFTHYFVFLMIIEKVRIEV